jgi:hypothetical protein
MKIQILATVLICFMLASCRKDNDFGQRGTITGIDLRECLCCGGWFININDSTYRFYQLPDQNNIDLENANFPVEVILTWKKDPNVCLGDEIIILRIEKI